MDELDKFLSDFYSKYAPDTLTPERVNAIKAGYGNNYDRLITDLYTKYSPDKLPDSAKMAQIKEGYGLSKAVDNQEELRKLAIQNPVDAPNWFGKLGSVITNDVPQMAATSVAALEGINREYLQNKVGGGVERPTRATLLNGELEPMQSYLRRVEKWEKYNKDHSGEIRRSKEIQKSLLEYAQQQKLEAEEDTRGSVKRLDQINSFTDAMDWLGGATAQAVAHIPASSATFGASAILMETGEVYLSAVEKIAEDKSIELGRPVTVAEVIENGWDDPASAWAYGTAAGALDYLGAKGVTRSFAKDQAIREIKARGLDILKSGGFEGLTEASQSIIEQVGAMRGADKTWAEAFSSIDPKDVLESAAQGIAGGGAISTVGNIKGAATAKRSDKLAEDKATKDNIATGSTISKEEKKIDEITNAVAVIDPATTTAVDQAIKPILDDTQDDLDLLAAELLSSQQTQEEQKEIEEVKGREETIDELETKIADLKSKMKAAVIDDKPKVWKELKEARRQYKEAVAENDRLNYESDKAEFEANYTPDQLAEMSNEDEFRGSPEARQIEQTAPSLVEAPAPVVEPVKPITNDSENKKGVSSPKRERKGIVKGQPKLGRSKATPKASGEVQEVKKERVVAMDDAMGEDETDLGPAEPLYNPKKKEVKKEVKPKASADPLSDLEKEVSSSREKSKIASLKEYQKQIDEFEATPSFESLNKLKETQKKVKEEISKGRTDTYDLEITREQKKLNARLSSLEYSPKVKEAVREGKKAASSAEREVTKARSGVEKAYKEVVKLRETAQKKAVKAAEKRLGGTIDPSNALNLPIAKEDQQAMERWRSSAETAAQKYEQLSGKKLTKKEKENLERWGTFESEEERAMRELERDMEDFDNMEDRDVFDDGPEFSKADDYEKQTVKDVLTFINSNTQSALLKRTSELLLKGNALPKVQIKKQPLKRVLLEGGSYDTHNRTIALGPFNVDSNFIHELIHAYTHNALKTEVGVAERFSTKEIDAKFVKEINEIFDEFNKRGGIIEGYKSPSTYPTRQAKIEEFVAEAFSDSKVAKQLASMKIGKEESLLTRILRAVASLFGLPLKDSKLNSDIENILSNEASNLDERLIKALYTFIQEIKTARGTEELHFRKVDSLKSKLLKLDQKLGDSLLNEAKRLDSVRHSTVGIGMIDEEGNFIKGTRFIQGLKYITDETIEKLKAVTASIGGRATYAKDFYDAFTTANKLREQVGLPPVKLFVAPGKLAYDKGNMAGNELYGFYAPGQSGSIVVSENAFNERTTALHESIHPITSLFASIARLKLPENAKFNKFRDQLFDTHTVAKTQIESLINDLLSNKAVDSAAHTAVLQYFETATQEEFKQFIANNAGKLRGRNPSVFIYGLVNPSEMVSEAFANPAFTNLLVHTKDSKAKGGERNSVFYRIAKNIVDFLKAAYEQITGIEGSSYQRLLDIMSEFEEALQNGELAYDGLAESIIRKEETLEFAKKVKPNKPLPKSFVDKVVDQAIDKDILTLKAFKKYIADLNVKIASRNGETLDKGQVKQLVDTFKEKSKIDTLISDTKKVVEAAVYQSARYQTSPHFQDQVDQLMSIDETKIDPKDKRAYYDALLGLAEGKITPALAKMHTKYKAKERTETITATKGFGYRQLSEDAVRFKNPAQIVTDMSKHFTKNANALMETLYFNIMRAHSRASVATKKQLQGLIDLVKENKLVREDYLRAGIYGLLVRTSVAPDPSNPAWVAEVMDNIQYLTQTQKQKAAAVALGNEKRWDKKDIAVEDAIIKEFTEKIAEGTPLSQLLDQGQTKLYEKFRAQLEAMKPDVEENTAAYWGSKSTTKWRDQYNYFPAKVAGRNELAVLNDEAEAFQDVLLNEETDYGHVTPAQARYSKAYNKSRSVYLDLNLLSVADSYLQSTNYDLYATKELRVLNSVLRNKDTAATLGSKNVRVVRDSLSCHVRAATGIHYNFGTLVRNLEAAKDRLVIAKLGTTGQWFTQLFGQIGAIATYTSPAYATSAASTLAQFNKLYGKSFDQWIEENGAGLQVRDLFFETEQAVQSYAKDARKGTVAGKVLDFSDKSTRYSLKQSDRLAARLVYIASFMEAGGDFAKPSKEALVAAERKTILSQNVSDLSFAPSIFRPETASSRVFLSTVMPFKSFSLQQMLNTYNSLRDIGESTEAKKLFAANVASTFGYTIMQATAVKWLYTSLFAPFFGAAQEAVAEVVGADAWAEALKNRDDEDEEKSYGFWEGVFTNSMLDLFFSGAPLQAEKLLDYTLNNYLAPNISSLRKGDRAFNEYLDSPIVTPGSVEQLMFSMFGGYQEIASIGTGIAGNALGWTSDQLFQVFSDEYVKKPNTEFPVSAQYRLLMVDAIGMFGVFLPFRGDIVKANRELARELKSEELGSKGSSSRFRRSLRRGG